jgi:O-antigen/teichoic acid export membrane protein
MYVPFLLLIPGVWALSNLFVLSAYFGGINKVKINVQGALISLLFILLMDYLFIPSYGIIAAAIISSVGYIINFLFSFKHLQREHKVSIEQYWQISKDDITWLKALLVRS